MKPDPKLVERQNICARRMANDNALEAALKDKGYSLNDFQRELFEQVMKVPALNMPPSGLGPNDPKPIGPWVSDMIAPGHEEGETWLAIVQGADGKLYAVPFTITGDEPMINGDPKEIEPTSDWEYIGEANEAKAAEMREKALKAGSFRGGGSSHKQAKQDADEFGNAAKIASREAHRAGKDALDADGHKLAMSLHDSAMAMHTRAGTKRVALDDDDAAEDHMSQAESHRSLRDEHKGKMEACMKAAAEGVKAEDAGAVEAKNAGPLHAKQIIAALEEGILCFMPSGTQTITPSCGGKPVTVTVMVDESAAVALESQRKAMEASGAKPFFSIGEDSHKSDVAAFWPSKFFWDKRLDATGSFVEGVWAEGEWTKSGREAVEGKDFRTFSPTFWVDKMPPIRSDEKHPAKIICKKDAGPNMGALVNDPAFQISPLWAKNNPPSAGVKTIREIHDALKASRGLDITLSDVRREYFRVNKQLTTDEEVAEALLKK